MKRREFILLLGGAAALPLAARAQQAGKVWRVGMLDTTPATINGKNIDAFRGGMRALGYVEGQNLRIDYRSFDGRIERLPQLADPVGALTLISRNPDGKWRVPLVDGSDSTAIAVQRAYLNWVRAHPPLLDAEWGAVLSAWEEVLDDLERDPLSTSDRLDWSAKYRLIEQFRESEKLERDDPWLRSLDLAYHLLDRSQGLYYGLLDSGALRLPYSLKEITGPELRAPDTTRAVLRGGCIEKFGSVVESAQWDAVVLRDRERRIELDLSDVFSAEQLAQGRAVLAAAHSPADLLSLPFAKII